MNATEKEVRQWYDAHGMEYLPEDWDRRDAVGESAGAQHADRDRVGREWVHTLDPEVMYDMETDEGGRIMLLWSQREDHEVLAAVEEFFTPYIALMPAAKRRVLDEYLLGHRSQEDIARELGVDQSTVSRRLWASARWLTRLVAQDTNDSTATDEQRAWAVFNEFWLDRFGVDWPLREA
jgi:hypothetical protein